MIDSPGDARKAAATPVTKRASTSTQPSVARPPRPENATNTTSQSRNIRRRPSWSLLVIALLDRRRLRFTALMREIDGVSQRMLTVTLRQLERDGLVTRTVHPEIPPRVEYELTPMGTTLHETIQALVTWTEEHQNQIAAARAAYDAR